MKKQTILWIILLLPYLGAYGIWKIYKHKIAIINNSTFIIVTKEDMRLTVYDYRGKKIDTYPIACGKNYGNKEEQGDLKTPEGVFNVCDIQNASDWKHDFNDGKGKIQGAYGPFFIRLMVPNYNGIGIHGTHDSNSIGTRVTEGCIRLNNKDLIKLVKQIRAGTVVVILPSKKDITS